MKKENGTEENKQEVVQEATAVAQEVAGEIPTTSEAKPEDVAKPEKLSLRDALEVAFEGTKTQEVKHESKRDRKAEREAAAKEQAEALAENATKEAPALEAPAEYTSEEKADFMQLSRKGQEAQLRPHNSRRSKVEEINKGLQELSTFKKLSESVNPYLKAMGIKENSEVAIQKALKMWHEFENGDPKAMAAEYLRAKGLEVPPELTAEAPKVDPQISSLQEKLNAVESRLAQEEYTKTANTLSQAWGSFEQEKNAAGAPKFPDINNTESGIRLASNIGSLVVGNTELSKQFIANAQARIPNLTYNRLLEEAYRYCGGKVDESAQAPKFQASQDHLAKSRRAAASVPGRSTQLASNSGVKKFKSYREAAQAALAELNSEN